MSGMTMHLYLVRHAEALPAGGNVLRDTDRVLSDRGSEDAASAGRILALVDPGIRLILTSPLFRARATGSLIAAQFALPPEIRESDALSPGFRRSALLEELRSLGPSARVAAVGHHPDLGQLLSSLIIGMDHAAVSFPPGAVAAVTLGSHGPGADAHLRWFLTPALTAALTAQQSTGGNR